MKKRKLFIGLAAIGTALAVLPMFAAFEAHVINVTATIENALTVPVKFLEYGTVFPQEYLVKPVEISLSNSFVSEGRVDDVEYFVRQKPKCAITSENGTVYDNTVVDGAHVYTGTGHVSVGDNPATTSTVETDFASIDCGPAPRTLAEGETWGVLPSLCPYLSKHKEDDGQFGSIEVPGKESQLDAFHQPYSVVSGTIQYNDAKGYLTKIGQDVSDTWQIDLAVPCFGNYCAQDWASFVQSHNPTQDTQEEANSWTQPISNEHKVFGCDLWVEVSGVSESQAEEPVRPTTGALLSAVSPGVCDVTVNPDGEGPNLDTITAGIAATEVGQTVCVVAGTYPEDVNVDKDITLVGAGAATTNIIGQTSGEPGALVITADGATVEGFTVTEATGGVAAIRISGAHSGITVNNNQMNGATGGNAFLTDAGQSNHVISNNVINGGDAGQPIAYVNGLASVNVASDNVDFLNNTFGGSGSEALGQEAGNSQIQLNTFSSVTSFTDVEDWEGGNLYNQNNFNDAGLNLQHSENGNTGDNGITNAENNWWGDTDPTDGDAALNVDVDFTPFELSAFPQN